MFMSTAAETHDPQRATLVLSQLSYFPEQGGGCDGH